MTLFLRENLSNPFSKVANLISGLQIVNLQLLNLILPTKVPSRSKLQKFAESCMPYHACALPTTTSHSEKSVRQGSGSNATTLDHCSMQRNIRGIAVWNAILYEYVMHVIKRIILTVC